MKKFRTIVEVTTMYLIEIFLPLYDNDGRQFSRDEFDRVRTELTERFGGVTAFLRAPAVGVWRDEQGEVRRDDIAILEVMTEVVDRNWWREYRQQLQTRFSQDEIIARATPFEKL